MYAEASGNKAENARAVLTSKPFPALSTHCAMEFWYHAFGQSVGSLTVSIVEGSSSYDLWSIQGNQGDVWRKVTVRIPATTTYVVKFIVERGLTFSGDIALDDVSFHPCQGMQTVIITPFHGVVCMLATS